jgi:hypothetical protein
MSKIAIRTFLMAFALLGASIPAFAQISVGVSVSFGPPAIPVYDQPVCPGDGYIWTPGYWAWDSDDGDYYWVPGTWVEPPQVGLFWTPGYWAWNDGAFVFYDGYWGPEVGFYGGIDYGFGYFGDGFVGGRWDHDRFYYNRAVSNVNVTMIHNVYEQRVTNVTVNRVSYNGGNGGVSARPTPREQSFASQRHVAPVSAQMQHAQEARGNRDLRASANHGKPPVAATERPGAFSGHVATAKEAGAPYNPPPNRSAMNNREGNNPANNPNATARPTDNRPNNMNNERPNNTPNAVNPGRPLDSGSTNRVIHPKDMPAYERPAAPNTGNAKMDQKYQQQQQKLADQQDKQRQRLEQQQEKQHQQYQRQQADEQKNQALEQRHQQQTQQMQQRQAQEQQKLQQRQAARPSAAHQAPAERSAPAEHSKEPKQ